MKTAVVLGADTQLGLSLVKKLLNLNLTVYAGSEIELQITHPNLVDSFLNINDEKSIESFYDLIRDSEQSISYYFNLINYMDLESLSETTIASLNKHYLINAAHSIYALSLAKPFFEFEDTVIFNLLGITSLNGYPDSLGYVMSKHALKGGIECLKVEWEREKYQFVDLYFGAIDDSDWDKYENVFERDKMLSLEDVIYIIETIINSPTNLKFNNISFSSKSEVLNHGFRS
ncbi:hypothetical protein N9N67_10610 [Bacteriovoracaceae bacterium]|nr:hypothetical protein [Bacteriovoracaceae bacterium]